MVARVGSDLFGPSTIENFKKMGIDATHVKQVEGVSSGVAPIFVEPNGQNRILVVKGANDELKPADIDAAADLLKAVDCIVLQFEIPHRNRLPHHRIRAKKQHSLHRQSRARLSRSISNSWKAWTTSSPTKAKPRPSPECRSKNVDDAKKCAEKLLGYGIKPRHYYARRQRLAAGGKRRHGACAGVSGEEC